LSALVSGALLAERFRSVFQRRRRHRYWSFVLGAVIEVAFAMFGPRYNAPVVTADGLSESVVRAVFGFVFGVLICALAWWVFGPVTQRLSTTTALSAYSLGNPGGVLMSYLCTVAGERACWLFIVAVGRPAPPVLFEIYGASFMTGAAVAVIIAANRADRVILRRAESMGEWSPANISNG